MKIEEIQIAAPWGHIAVKLWGDEKNEAIIVLHGVLDNAGAFDNIIPLLPENFYYICVDLPGHGRSANFHMSLMIHVVDYIVPINLVADYFKREKYVLLGHSLGGQLAMFYAHIFRERISKVILLDAMYLFLRHSNIFLDNVEDAFHRLNKTVAQSEMPKLTYTMEQAVQKLIDGRELGQLTKSAAKPLAKRMFERIGENEYVMNIDSRLKNRLYPSGNMEYLLELHKSRPIEKPVLILLASETKLFEILGPLYLHYIKMGYEIHVYEGHHDMHNTNPDVIAPFVVNFLLKHRHKL